MTRTVQSIERGMLVLGALAAADGPLGITDLSDRTELPYATIHRLLATLAQGGYVRQARGTKKYVLGPALMRLGTAAGRVLRVLAQPYLEDVARATGETANLAILEGDQVVYLAQAQSPQKMRMFTHVGNLAPVHSTAVGKTLLAFHPRQETLAMLDRFTLEAVTPKTITKREPFLQELDSIAQRGWALDDEEGELGVKCLAVPVYSRHPGAAPLAAISVSGPAGRMTDDALERMVPHLTYAAAQVAKQPDDPYLF